MIVSIVAFGTLGDVQPLAALAAALAARDHQVRLLAPDAFAHLASGRGVDFQPLAFDILADSEREVNRKFFASGGSPISTVAGLARVLRLVAARAPNIMDATRGSDLIVGGGFTDSVAAMAAQYWKIPCVHAYLQPALASRDIPFSFAKPTRFALPGWANIAMSLGAEKVIWFLEHSASRNIRNYYHLPSTAFQPRLRRAVKSGDTLLLGYSETLLRRSRDWPQNVEVTGYWFLDGSADWTPPQSLRRFIDSGSPPVYVGFGSMKLNEPRATLDVVLKAVKNNGARAVVSAGWGGLKAEGLPDFAIGIDAAPHDWLFPRMAAIIHHGGIGTTCAALRAGKPSVVVPFITDQFFWAKRLQSSGVAPAATPHRRLTAEALGAAIGVALSDAGMRKRAADVGALVRAEDGVGRAVAAIEQAARPRPEAVTGHAPSGAVVPWEALARRAIAPLRYLSIIRGSHSESSGA